MHVTNEMLIVLKIFKTPEMEFNANSISKEAGLTPMGALKILKRLEKEDVLASKAAGKAVFYRFNSITKNPILRPFMAESKALVGLFL